MTDAAAGRRRFPTAILLTCVAIGVAGGVLLAPANWLSTVLVAVGSPVASMAIVGFWLLPAVVALRLLRRPGVGILVGVVSGLVIVPFSGYGFMSIVSNASWAVLAELPFLVTLWKFWPTWMHYIGALATGVIYPITAWQFFDMGARRSSRRCCSSSSRWPAPRAPQPSASSSPTASGAPASAAGFDTVIR